MGCLLAGCTVPPVERWRTDVAIRHLRAGVDPEWDDYGGTPDGHDLVQEIRLEQPLTDGALVLYQAGVKKKWIVELNGQRLGELPLQEEPLLARFPVKKEQLRIGANTLRLLAPKDADDIRVGVAGLGDAPAVAVEVNVLEAGRGSVPARITVVDETLGALAAVVADPSPKLAVRPGVVYTSTGHAKFRLPPGRYAITASRGFEYGIDVQRVKLEAGAPPRALALTIRREVPTPRWIACDTHVHTLTLSGHGDCALEERMVTLAGEGVELPVAAEHNRHASYREAAATAGVERWFTPVDGNEVTTKKGHYNVFPVRPGAPVPDFKEEDRAKLLASIRASGATIAILNHPRSVHDKHVPFAPPHFDRATAADVGGYGYDAMELVNSGALRTDYMEPYRDWFALLNRGIRVVGVGSSDSHDVSRFIVGQGRTYIAGPDEAPGAIDVEGAARALAEGRALVSLGLLVNLKVAERFGVGDLATGLPAEMPVTVTVHGPAWTRVDRVTLYANGLALRDEAQAGAHNGGLKLSFTWRIPRPAHDVHLVAIATGPAPEGLHWPLPRPYQPSSPTWVPRVIGSTNPVWIDGDGDGAFLAARAIAQRLVEAKADPSRYDEAVRLHVKDLLTK
ncbi:MAG TPA: CehA/McbA family metallohydrolase [Planctomycetota bacterium]